MNAPRTKIFVGHLPDGCRSEDLLTLFSKFGTVTECDVINKYGFVHMRTPDEAEKAIRGLNNYNLMGSAISVEHSKSRLHPEPGAPGRARGGGNAGGSGMGSNFGSRRGGSGGGPPRNGYGPSQMNRGSSDTFRTQFDKPSSDHYFSSDRLPFGGAQDRMRTTGFAHSAYDQPPSSTIFSSMPAEEFRPRTYPAPVGTRGDPYSALQSSMASRTDPYDRFMASSSFMYSQRSPPRTVAYEPVPSQSRPYSYYDSVSMNPNQPSADMSRRPFMH